MILSNMSKIKELKTELPKIYIRKTDIPVTKTRKEFITKFLELSPASYNYNEELETDPGKYRSFSHLWALTKDRFPVTSLNSIIRIIAQLNLRGRCDVVYCTKVTKFVIRPRTQGTEIPFVSNYSTKYFSKHKGVDDISYELLMKIREEEKIK